MAQALNLSTPASEAGGSWIFMSWRSGWFTWIVPSNPELLSETLLIMMTMAMMIIIFKVIETLNFNL